MKKILLLILILATGLTSRSQVLISLVFGDVLNSPNVEFGLDGGVNFTSISNLEPSKSSSLFNLGFYFDIRLKGQLYLHTGVLVKSSQGADKLAPYSLNDPDLDALFANGYVTRKVNYFGVPIMAKYRFAKIFHVEAGPMLSLRSRGYDTFNTTVNSEDDLSFKVDIKNNYKRIDAGIMLGAGVKLSKQPKSAQAGIRYYYGFIDPLKSNTGESQNFSSLYLYFSIPIGAHKAESDAETK